MVTRASIANASACWSCGAEHAPSAHFCAACGKVQPATAVDHFAFFGLPRKLNVNVAALEREFYPDPAKIARTVHAMVKPDAKPWIPDAERSKLAYQVKFRGPF